MTEVKIKLNNKIRETKKYKDLIYSDEWRETVDPLLIGEFERNITMMMINKEKELDYLNNARAIYNLCDRLGKQVNLGEQAKKQLLKLQNKR